MKKEYRLAKNADFKNVLNNRHSQGNSSIVIYSAHNSLNHSRVGITISGKAGNAVERNKAKRQVRMMVMKNFNLERSTDYVIIIKRKFISGEYLDNEKTLAYLYKKL